MAHAENMWTADDRRVPDAPVEILVIDHRDDHRELMAEVLEPAFVGNVWLAERPWPGLGRPRVLVVSLQGEPEPVLDWMEELGGPPPAVIALTGPDRRWSTADERRLQARGRLDKRSGTEFLKDLVARVREALEEPEPLEAVPAAPDLAPELPEPVPFAPEDLERRPPEPPAHTASEPAGAPVLEVLAEELRERTAYLAAAAQQLGQRIPADAVSRAGFSSLEREARRCQALTARLAAMLDPGEASGARRPRPVRLCELVPLREDAWRLWAGSDDRLLIRGEATVLGGRVHPDTVGPALDGVVRLALEGAREARGRVVVRCDSVLVDDTMTAGRPALAPGRQARLRVELEPTDWDGRGGFPEIPPRLRAMAIAAVKSERGFLDDGSIGSEDRAVSIYVPIAPEDPPRRGPGETPWVAVVDDEEPMREIGSAVIREAGAVASSLESGEELLRRVGAGCRYRLVLLDLAMPGMDGAATYRALRELDRSAAVVLVSGADQPNRVRELLDEGVLGFLRKPFDVPRLLRIVHCALGSPAAPQELPK